MEYEHMSNFTEPDDSLWVDDSVIPSTESVRRNSDEPPLSNEWLNLALKTIGEFLQQTETQKALVKRHLVTFRWPTMLDGGKSANMWLHHHKTVIPYLEDKGYTVTVTERRITIYAKADRVEFDIRIGIGDTE